MYCVGCTAACGDTLFASARNMNSENKIGDERRELLRAVLLHGREDPPPGENRDC